MAWFKSKDGELEKGIVELYTTMLISGRGLSSNEAGKIVRGMLEVAKQRMKETSQDKLPPNFGNIILGKEKENASFMNINIKREDGVRDKDIIWFWNMHPLERCMLEIDDENSRMTTFMANIEKGISHEESANQVRKFHPMFGDPKDITHTHGDDRPLPPELKDRINKWIEKQASNTEAVKQKLQQYSTMNAFIRAEIKAGNI